MLGPHWTRFWWHFRETEKQVHGLLFSIKSEVLDFYKLWIKYSTSIYHYLPPRRLWASKKCYCCGERTHSKNQRYENTTKVREGWWHIASRCLSQSPTPVYSGVHVSINIVSVVSHLPQFSPTLGDRERSVAPEPESFPAPHRSWHDLKLVSR